MTILHQRPEVRANSQWLQVLGHVAHRSECLLEPLQFRKHQAVVIPVDAVEGMSRALLKLQRRLDSRLCNHLRRFPEPELRVARPERRHQLRHVLAVFDAAEALGRFQHPGGDPA